jgi:hypothetical protein
MPALRARGIPQPRARKTLESLRARPALFLLLAELHLRPVRPRQDEADPVTDYPRILGKFFLIAICAILGLSLEWTGQTFYFTGRWLMGASGVVQDYALELLGVTD